MRYDNLRRKKAKMLSQITASYLFPVESWARTNKRTDGRRMETPKYICIWYSRPLYYLLCEVNFQFWGTWGSRMIFPISQSNKITKDK
jgi:hypothetical protein